MSLSFTYIDAVGIALLRRGQYGDISYHDLRRVDEMNRPKWTVDEGEIVENDALLRKTPLF